MRMPIFLRWAGCSDEAPAGRARGKGGLISVLKNNDMKNYSNARNASSPPPLQIWSFSNSHTYFMTTNGGKGEVLLHDAAYSKQSNTQSNTQREGLTAVHKLTNAHPWLVSIRLTATRLIPSTIPPAKRDQFLLKSSRYMSRAWVYAHIRHQNAEKKGILISLTTTWFLGTGQGGLHCRNCWSSADFHAQQCLEFIQGGVKSKKHPVNDQILFELTMVSQIATLYRCGDQKSIPTHQTLRWLGFTLLRSPFISTMDRNLRLQWTSNMDTLEKKRLKKIQSIFFFFWVCSWMMRIEGERRCVKPCNGISHSFIIKLIYAGAG